MQKATGPDKAKALQDEIKNQGLTMTEAIGRVVKEFLGEDPAEDQVRGLAATFAKTLGVKPDRFVALWREARLRR
jgi:hypothetical protein